MAKKKDKTWIISLNSERKLADVKADITKAGFEIQQTMSEIGCLTGIATESVANKVGRIEGVIDVSPEGNIDIGPPGSETTW